MSTQPYANATEPEIEAASTLFLVQNAPRTFDPTNTNPCPEMFADKWQVTDES